MNFKSYYQNIYQTFAYLTPLYFDCGMLCQQKCCQNNCKGMLLFPYEELYLSSTNNNYQIEKTGSLHLLYCKGTCDRNIRPLSCMIFPLFPYLYEDNRLVLKMDPRSKYVCPLYFTDISELTLQPFFRLKLFTLFYEMSKIEEINAFLKMMTKELLELEKFTI